MEMPKEVMYVLEKLNNAGFKSYIVGGCVRDNFMKRLPKDWDVTTSALPEEIMDIFIDEKTIEIGKRFGTITVIKDSHPIEITTFRSEGDYIDGRRPGWVEFQKDIEADLSRRDFTINAMAYNDLKGLVDPFNGRGDINKRLIRTVGNPKKRFNEDALRLLRAIRFSTELGFEIEKNTYKNIKEHKDNLLEVSIERIADEFLKILLSDKPSNGIRLLVDTGVIKYIIPEIVDTVDFNQCNPHHDKNVFDHILCVVDNSPKDIELRLAALLHDIGKPDTFTKDEEGIGHFYNHDKVGAELSEKILKRLKAPKKAISLVSNLVKEHMIWHNDISDKGLKRLINRVGEENIIKLLTLMRSDISCSLAIERPEVQEELAIIDKLEYRIKNILDNREALSIKDLSINGKDLIDLGVFKGPRVGEILNILLDKVMEDESLNKRDKLLEVAKKELQ
ncbi:CCA tRNA nucleotidyltransferase [Anaeromonas frigoriresistens]|nr:HD domain-containing protein [Anaeromonas frigoriresistens]